MKNQTYSFDEASKNEYHTYGFLITEEGIEFSVDGTVYSSINKYDPFWSNPNDAYRVSKGYNLGSDGLNDYYYFIIGCGGYFFAHFYFKPLKALFFCLNIHSLHNCAK